MHRRLVTLIVLVAVALVAVPVFAAHGWSTYHWNKPGAYVSPPVTMNLTAPWPDYAARVMADWNQSSVIESPWSFGAISTRKRCTSTTGQIEVCNSTYGNNGWLGIAGISLSGGHIVKGYTKLNDSYFNSATYNKPAWRRMVFCQEVGHDYGLGHVNENFNDPNTGSCMDYTNDPARNDGQGTNEYPNAHDYNQLQTQYGHNGLIDLPFDEMVRDATRPNTLEEYMNKAEQWGEPVAFDMEGRPTTFIRKTAPNHPSEEHGLEVIDIFWAPIPIDEDEIDKGGRAQ